MIRTLLLTLACGLGSLLGAAEPGTAAEAPSTDVPAPAMPAPEAAGDPWEIRLAWRSLPRSQTTKLTVQDQGSWEEYPGHDGDFSTHWRVDAQMVHRWGGERLGWQLAYGPGYGELQASNDLGEVRHRFFGLGAEITAVAFPRERFRLEAGAGVHAAYAAGEMLVSRSGGPVERLSSDYGVAYDASLRLRPVLRPAPWCEVFVSADYILRMQERLTYTEDDLEVLEINTAHGLGVGAGIGMRF